MDGLFDWIKTDGLEIAVILGLSWLAIRFGNIFIRKAVRNSISNDKHGTKEDKEKREKTLVGIIGATLKVFVYAIASLLVLANLGLNIGPLLAGAGIAGVAIGFGAQSLVTDFISGIFIIMENQYRVGDSIEVNNESGVVQKVSIRTTVLRNLDGELIYIPNGEIRIATNKSMEFSKINLDIGVAYDSDIDKVREVVNKVGEELAKEKEFEDLITEAPKFMRINDLGDSSVVIKINGKVKAGEQWKIKGELRERIKKAFDKEKIEIPFPQLDVHNRK